VNDAVKRIFYTLTGVALLCLLAVKRTMADGAPIGAWRLVVGIAAGFFFIYVGGVMYYLPKNRRERKELDDLIEESKGELREHRESKQVCVPDCAGVL
jgi:hypothetical protein